MQWCNVALGTFDKRINNLVIRSRDTGDPNSSVDEIIFLKGDEYKKSKDRSFAYHYLNNDSIKLSLFKSTKFYVLHKYHACKNTTMTFIHCSIQYAWMKNYSQPIPMVFTENCKISELRNIIRDSIGHSNGKFDICFNGKNVTDETTMKDFLGK